MKIEGHFVIEELASHIEEIHEEPSTQDHQLQEGHPLQEEHPSQQGPSSQKWPPAWFLEYFEKLNATMERTEQCQKQRKSDSIASMRRCMNNK